MNGGRILLCVFLLASTACADELADGYFDAAALDWSGDDLDYQQALCVADARTKALSGIELQMTSATWNDFLGFGTTIVGSAWDGYAEVPTELIADKDGAEVRWTMGLITYTPGSRPFPACAPIAFWERTEPTGNPDLDFGSIDNYVPEGFVWTIVPVTSGKFFHSPATANIAGVDYSDADEMPTFTELPPIPEPATAMLLIIGGIGVITRRRTTG